jgi:hypothetical protein
MNTEQSTSWEKSIGFVSQRNIFNQIVEAEYNYLERPYENMSDEALARITEPKGHTDIYQEYLRAGVIKIQTADHGEDTYDYAVSDASYTPIVNAQGFFIVGNTIYQVKENLIKEMEGVDISKLQLLDKAISDDLTNKIKVGPLFSNYPEPEARSAKSDCDFSRSSGWVTIGKRRGMTTVAYSATYWNPFPYKKVTISYNVSVRSQKKNGWGNWVYPSCPNECWISGTWAEKFRYMDDTTMAYAYTNSYTRSYSYSHPNCINYFIASINPTTGIGAPYPSSFTFTAPSNVAFTSACLTPMHWSVSVPGGASGINCDVYYP